MQDVHQGSLVLARKCTVSLGTRIPEETGLSVFPISRSHALFSESGPVGPRLTKELKIRHFSFEGEAIAASETWLDEIISELFEWLANLDQRAKKCIELRGFSVE